MFVRIVRIEYEQSGEPHALIPRKKIKDANNGNSEKLQSKFLLHLYPNLNKKKQIGKTKFGQSNKESYRTGEHFHSTLAFHKIHRRIRSPRIQSLEIRTERTFVNNKHNWRSTKLRYVVDSALSLFGITVLNTS